MVRIVLGFDEEKIREALAPVPFFNPMGSFSHTHDRVHVPVRPECFEENHRSLKVSWLAPSASREVSRREVKKFKHDHCVKLKMRLSQRWGVRPSQVMVRLVSIHCDPHLITVEVPYPASFMYAEAVRIVNEARQFASSDSLPTPAKQDGLSAIEVAFDEIKDLMREVAELPEGLEIEDLNGLLDPYREVVFAMESRLETVKLAHRVQLQDLTRNLESSASERANSILSLLSSPIPS